MFCHVSFLVIEYAKKNHDVEPIMFIKDVLLFKEMDGRDLCVEAARIVYTYLLETSVLQVCFSCALHSEVKA